MDITELTKSLNGLKDEVLAQAKTSQDASESKINALEKKLDEQIAKSVKEQEERKLSLPGLDEELKSGKKTFHFSKIVRAQVDRDYDLKTQGAFEYEVLEQTAKKSANGGTGAAGGYLIPEEAKGNLIDLAIAATPIKELGPTILTGLKGDLPIPKLTGRPTMYWVGEEEAATESGVTFGEIVLRPKTASAFTKVSRKLLYQTSNVAEAIVRDQLIKAFQLGLEQAILTGSGTDKQPKGLINYANITTAPAAVTGNRFRCDDAAFMQMTIDVANMLKPTGSFGYLMRPEILSGMKRERVMNYSTQTPSAGMPVMNPLVSTKVLEDLLGYKIRTTTLLTKGTTGGASGSTDSVVFFGDWSQLILAFWEGFELRSSDVAGNSGGSALTQNQIWIAAFQGMDIAVKDETGFCKVTDADTLESNWSV